MREAQDMGIIVLCALGMAFFVKTQNITGISTLSMSRGMLGIEEGRRTSGNSDTFG